MRKISKVLCTASAVLLAVGLYAAGLSGDGPPDAPTGFDNLTNGAVDQTTFDDAKEEFEQIQDIASGLGPVYNAQGCGECHQSPVTGGTSQITEFRAGPNHPGGSLINDRAIDASIQEHVLPTDTVVTFRTSLNTLGDGFVEAIADETLIAIANSQPSHMRGQVIEVPVLETGESRVGRFGWKNQHRSLLSFAGDAYLNEQGITNKFFLTENTSNGNSVAAFDHVDDSSPFGEDVNDDIEQFAAFMRATKAPPRGMATSDTVAGSKVFDKIGCNVCHVRTIVTAGIGTLDGFLFVPPELANKQIHPFGDFLLHNIGTGDGIVQNGGPSTRNKMRTAPLWGLRTHSRFMHDGLSPTLENAIERHQNEARSVEENFDRLSRTQRRQLLAFLMSL